jgi:hypothetical protein
VKADVNFKKETIEIFKVYRVKWKVSQKSAKAWVGEPAKKNLQDECRFLIHSLYFTRECGKFSIEIVNFK